MKKALLSLLLIFVCNVALFAQIPITQDFGVTSATPAGWVLSLDWIIDPPVATGGTYADCNLSGSSGNSKLLGLNSTGGFSTATYTFSGTGKLNITIGWNEFRDDIATPTPVLTVLASTDNFVTSTTLTVSEPTTAGVWAVVPTIALPSSFNNQAAIQLRFQYTADNSAQAVVIDDISINGTSAPIYYWKGSGNLDVLSSWGDVADGSGTAPVNFTTNGAEYNIINGTSATIGSAWNVSGTGTQIIVGNGTTWNTNFTIPATNALMLTNAILIVQNSSTLTLANSTNYLSAASTSLVANSSVDFAQGSNVTLWSGTTFQNLTISGTSAKSCSGSNVVSGILNLNGANLQMAGGVTLTLNGTKTGSGKFIAALGTISIGGSGAFGTLDFSVAAPSIRNLIINRASSGSVILGSNLTISSGGGVIATSLSNGILDLNGNTLTINRPIAFGSGFIKGSNSSVLSIGGTGTISGSMLMDQTSSTTKSLLALILNNSSASLTLGNSLNIIDSVKVSAGTLSCGGNLTLKSTSALKARIAQIGGTVSGNITVEMFVPGSVAGWRTLGASGINGLTIGNWDGGSGSSTAFAMTCADCINNSTSAGGYFVSVQGDASGTGVYTELTTASPITPGTGVWVYDANSSTTAIDVTLTKSGSVVTGSIPSGTGFMANPYPSPISVDRLKTHTAITSVDVWNGSTYTTYNGGIPSNAVIAMGQGFYANGATNITFQESDKVSFNTFSVLKTASTNIGSVFELQIAGANGDIDNTYIRFHGSATTGFDNDLDGYKRFATPGYLGYPGAYSKYTSINTVNSNMDYSINSLPYATTSNAVIPVRVKVSVTGTYSIMPVGIANLPSSACVTLKDKLLNIMHDLRSGAYVCSINDTTSTARFELTICADITAGINSLNADQNTTLINQDQNGAYVKTSFETNTKATISAFNVMGQKLMADKEIEGKDLTTYLDLGDIHSQVVIIRVTTAKTNTTKKIFIN